MLDEILKRYYNIFIVLLNAYYLQVYPQNCLIVITFFSIIVIWFSISYPFSRAISVIGLTHEHIFLVVMRIICLTYSVIGLGMFDNKNVFILCLVTYVCIFYKLVRFMTQPMSSFQLQAAYLLLFLLTSSFAL